MKKPKTLWACPYCCLVEASHGRVLGPVCRGAGLIHTAVGMVRVDDPAVDAAYRLGGVDAARMLLQALKAEQLKKAPPSAGSPTE